MYLSVVYALVIEKRRPSDFAFYYFACFSVWREEEKQ